MHALFRALVASFAALLGFTLFALAQSTAASGDDVAVKREDTVSVLSADDDDDDDEDTEATFDSNTGESADGTSSRVTGVSRDRDVSNDDLTKDRTMDGGDPTRDHTQNHTNDATRDDTR
ncbi:MAG: hypothetical protein ACRDWY_03570 [Actinomycetes bacterium]